MEHPGQTRISTGETWPTTLMYYLAGFADGEGCFRYDGRTTRAGVTNAYPWVLQMFQKMWGGSIRRRSPRSPNHKPVYNWEVSGELARAYSKDISPFLREKRRQADLVIRIMDQPSGSPERVEMIRQLKELKHVEYVLIPIEEYHNDQA